MRCRDEDVSVSEADDAVMRIRHNGTLAWVDDDSELRGSLKTQ